MHYLIIEMKSLLDKLDIQENNRGSCFGTDGWISNDGGSLIISTNPTNGEIIGTVETASSKSYEHILSKASTIACTSNGTQLDL